MKSLFLVSFIFFNAFFTAASIAHSANTTEGQSPETCKECSPSAGPTIPTDFIAGAQDFLAKLNASMKCGPNSDKNNCLLIEWLQWKHHDYAKNCKGFFLDENGVVGSFSKLTTGLMAEDVKKFGDQSLFMKTNVDFDRICPNFKNFTMEQKIAFHGWIFELTAFPESTCDINVKPNTSAPNDVAVCMYQLEKNVDKRKWRSSRFSPKRCAVSSAEILTVAGCTGCAFDEYKRKMTNDGTPFGVFDANGKKISGSYWASHNPLSATQLACFEQYFDRKTKKPMMTGKKATYLIKCPNSNNEWFARYKFFGRLPRFPLCGSDAAKAEIEGLNAYKASLKK